MQQYKNNLSNIRKFYNIETRAGTYGDFYIIPDKIVWNLKMNNMLLGKKTFGLGGKSKSHIVVRDNTIYTEPLVYIKGAIPVQSSDLKLEHNLRAFVADAYVKWYLGKKDIDLDNVEPMKIKLPKRVRSHQTDYFVRYIMSITNRQVFINNKNIVII